MKKIRVLKPFVFSIIPKAGGVIAQETKFHIGEHEIADEIADHPWIKSLADGHIESDEEFAKRVQVDEERLALEAAINEKARVDAEAAFARVQEMYGQNGPSIHGDDKNPADDLNAPIDQEKLNEELNTPINELNKRGKKKSAAG